MRLQVDADVVAEPRDATMRPRHTSAMVGAPGPPTAAAVVAAEQRRGEVEDVAVDEAGPVEVAGDGGAALDQGLDDTPAPELVEHVAEVARQLEGGLDLGARRAPCPSTTRSGSRPSTWRTVSVGSSARTVPAPTMTASLSARRRWASARAASPVIHCDGRRARRCGRRAWRPASAPPRAGPCVRCLR